MLCGTMFDTYTNQTFYFLVELNSVVFGVFISRNYQLRFTSGGLCLAWFILLKVGLSQ